MTVSISSLLSATLTANAQNQSKLTQNAISNTLTTRLNKQIAQLQSQAADTTTIQLLQSQLNAANTQNSAFSQASSQYLANERYLSDLSTQLASMNTAATAGDSATFDAALTAAQYDVADLNVVAYVPGTQTDGVVNLKLNGLNVQSSATYNLSTPAGQAQAQSDVANATSLITQITNVTLQNQSIASSSSDSFTTQINDLTRRLAEISDNQNNTVQTEISKLQQREQYQFHVIELALQNTGRSSSVLTSAASNLASVLATQQGSRTASKANPFMSALQAGIGIANKLNGVRLAGAAKQPDASTTQQNSTNQAATGTLLNLFS